MHGREIKIACEYVGIRIYIMFTMSTKVPKVCTACACLTINYIMIHVMHFTKFYNSFTAMPCIFVILGRLLCRCCSNVFEHVKSAI